MRVNISWFKLLNSGTICYTAIDNTHFLYCYNLHLVLAKRSTSDYTVIIYFYDLKTSYNQLQIPTGYLDNDLRARACTHTHTPLSIALIKEKKMREEVKHSAHNPQRSYRLNTVLIILKDPTTVKQSHNISPLQTCETVASWERWFRKKSTGKEKREHKEKELHR